MELKNLIKKQLATCEFSNHEYIEDTGWLEGASPAKLENLYELYAQKAESLIQSVVVIQGSVTHHTTKDDFFSSWFPELFYGAAWQVSDKFVFAGAVHHDKETPIALILGAVSEAEIKELESDDEW